MTPLGCPHCKNALPPSSPGVVRCPGCSGFATIPGPSDIARIEKKRRDEKTVLLAIAAVVFVVYVLPVLLTVGYFCFVLALSVMMMIAALATSAT